MKAIISEGERKEGRENREKEVKMCGNSFYKATIDRLKQATLHRQNR